MTLHGRARQAVELTRLDASPAQIAAADRMLHDMPMGAPGLFTEVEPTAACVTAAHWLRAAVDAPRATCSTGRRWRCGRASACIANTGTEPEGVHAAGRVVDAQVRAEAGRTAEPLLSTGTATCP